MGDREELLTEIERAVGASKFGARSNYYAAFLITTITVGGSISAALLVALDAKDHVLTALIAAIPAAALSLSSAFHFERKSAWYWKKVKLLEGLVRALRYESAETAAVSRKFSEVDGKLDDEWVRFGRPDDAKE